MHIRKTRRGAAPRRICACRRRSCAPLWTIRFSCCSSNFSSFFSFLFLGHARVPDVILQSSCLYMFTLSGAKVGPFFGTCNSFARFSAFFGAEFDVGQPAGALRLIWVKPSGQSPDGCQLVGLRLVVNLRTQPSRRRCGPSWAAYI